MAETKFNADLMKLNQSQLVEFANRNDIRSKRREILEKILADRENYVTRTSAQGYRTAKLFVLLVLTAMVSCGYLAYYLTMH